MVLIYKIRVKLINLRIIIGFQQPVFFKLFKGRGIGQHDYITLNLAGFRLCHHLAYHFLCSASEVLKIYVWIFLLKHFTDICHIIITGRSIYHQFSLDILRGFSIPFSAVSFPDRARGLCFGNICLCGSICLCCFIRLYSRCGRRSRGSGICTAARQSQADSSSHTNKSKICLFHNVISFFTCACSISQPASELAAVPQNQSEHSCGIKIQDNNFDRSEAVPA